MSGTETCFGCERELDLKVPGVYTHVHHVEDPPADAGLPADFFLCEPCYELFTAVVDEWDDEEASQVGCSRCDDGGDPITVEVTPTRVGDGYVSGSTHTLRFCSSCY